MSERDEFDARRLALTSLIDQRAAEMPLLATLVYSIYTALVEEGFGADDALYLAGQYLADFVSKRR